ncbi:MAG: hypothetical protein ACI92N_002006 [Pseudomonadales bacterium]|jgi:hypothetical protein
MHKGLDEYQFDALMRREKTPIPGFIQIQIAGTGSSGL